jgi:hypothetical protein
MMFVHVKRDIFRLINLCAFYATTHGLTMTEEFKGFYIDADPYKWPYNGNMTPSNTCIIVIGA